MPSAGQLQALDTALSFTKCHTHYLVPDGEEATDRPGSVFHPRRTWGLVSATQLRQERGAGHNLYKNDIAIEDMT